MLSVVDLQFNNERNFHKEKVVYHKGNVIGRPKTASRPLLIPRIKKVRVHSGKKMKIQKENTLTYKTEEEEEDEKHLLGNILKDAFTASELNNIVDIDPNPRVNRTKKKKQQKEKEEEERKKHIKPYIPPSVAFMTEAIEADSAGNEVKERELKRTIHLFENNEAIENKVKMIVKESKILKMFNEKKSEQPVKENFVPIVDINEDKKYQQATEDMKRYKEQCESLKKKTIDVNQTLKQNEKKDLGGDNKISLKQQNEIKVNAQKIIDNIKTNVDPSNFDINTLNERDRKLLMGAARYRPQKRKEKKVNSNKIKNDELLLKSISSLNALKEKQSKIKNELSQQLNIDFKEELIQDSWKIDDMLSTSYCNNLKKGQMLTYRTLKNKTNKEVNRKEDFFDYMYFKDESESTTYSHPFLIYD